MPEQFLVRIAKAEHVFSAAHFITFNGICERLHGHNYHVSAEVAGPLDENHYVIDFIFLRDQLRTIASELDHHVLLPTEHPQIRVIATDDEVTANFDDRRWVFPRDDCRLLALANTTSELLARHIGQQLGKALASAGIRPIRIQIEVDECDGQLGIWCDSAGS